jgi:methyl-accepting chemotaxis protein
MAEKLNEMKRHAESGRLYNEGSGVYKNVQETLSDIEDSTDAQLDDIKIHEFDAELNVLQSQLQDLETEIRQYGQMSETSNFSRMKFGQVMICQTGAAKLKNTASELYGLAPEEIVVSVRRVTDIMDEIMAVSQMDQVTQQNAALVEQAAAALQMMQEQALNLIQAVSVFKLNETRAGAHEPGLPRIGSAV